MRPCCHCDFCKFVVEAGWVVFWMRPSAFSKLAMPPPPVVVTLPPAPAPAIPVFDVPPAPALLPASVPPPHPPPTITSDAATKQKPEILPAGLFPILMVRAPDVSWGTVHICERPSS